MSGLWGEIEKYLVPTVSDKQVPVLNTHVLLQTPDVSQSGIPETSNTPPRIALIQESPTAQIRTEPVKDKGTEGAAGGVIAMNRLNSEAFSQVAATMDVKADTKLEEELNAEELQEIEWLKRRYVIGKVAGVDIYDDLGSRLIARDETITESTLNQVEQAGKLLDLVLHMTVPDWGTDA